MVCFTYFLKFFFTQSVKIGLKQTNFKTDESSLLWEKNKTITKIMERKKKLNFKKLNDFLF